jgi:tetratricopeptide (TPR) repeat protein
VNDLFSKAEHMHADSLRKKSWDVGVMQRGYYVAGAHMSRTIDEQLGRDALIETITTGPLCFVDTYNGLVDETMKVFAFGKSVPLSLIQRLKSAADRSDHTDFENIANGMKTNIDSLPSGIRRRIRRLGWGMLYQEDFEWAMAIFKVILDLFPESAVSYCSLAEAHLRSGNKENAIRCYKQALKVDPDFKFAQRKLKEME